MQLFTCTGGDAASYTSGFPSRVTYRVSLRAGPYTRLIPEMNFACNGVITGYTAALMDRNGDQDPVIQIWRRNPGFYFKTSPGIAIDNALCIDGLIEVASGHGVTVFHCNLNQTRARVVSVEAGDILGLDLPTGNNDDIRLAFARVSSGPTNYVFDTSESELSMYSRALSRHYWVIRELPQITLEIGSGKYTLICGII